MTTTSKRDLPIWWLAALLALTLTAAPAQSPVELAGRWQGTLDAGAAKLRLVLDLTTAENGGYRATLTSLDQGDALIPIAGVVVDDGMITLDVSAVSGRYEGRIGDDGKSLTGTWTQGMSFPLEFRRLADDSSTADPPAAANGDRANGAAANSTAPPAALEPPPPGTIDREVDRAIRVRLATGEYVGLSIAVLDGDSIDYYHYGVTDRDSGGLPDENSLYEIGSITKTFTTLALARLALEGELDLAAPVHAALEELPTLGTEDMPVTFLHLATHRSGLPRLPSDLDATNIDDPYADYDWDDLVSFLESHELQPAPGESFEYSNLGVGLLGAVLARMHGQSYRSFIQDTVLEPLGMNDTDSVPTDESRAVAGHGPTGDVVSYWDVGVLAGAGDLVSSAKDMATYLRAHMGAEPTPLASAIDLTHQQTGVRDEQPRIGLGWLIDEVPAGEILWHNGGTGGFRSFAGFRADGRRGAVVLGNTMVSVDDIGRRLVSPGSPLVASREAVTLSDSELSEYLGRYEIAAGIEIVIAKRESALTVQLTGQPAVPIFASGEDRFFLRVVPADISFARAPAGEVEALVLHQNGVDRQAKRLEQ